MYEIVLVENRVKIKTLYSYIRLRDAKYRLNKIKTDRAFVPKKSIYKGKKLIRVIYEVLLLKKRIGDEKNFIDININDDEWVVVDKIDYDIEELYNVTGANRKLTGNEILNHIVLNKQRDPSMKQILILNNKVIIEGNELFMVTCKDLVESIRLYNAIRIHCFDNKITDLIFFGTVPKENKKFWYKKIHKKTGTKYNRLYRSKSR